MSGCGQEREESGSEIPATMKSNDTHLRDWKEDNMCERKIMTISKNLYQHTHFRENKYNNYIIIYYILDQRLEPNAPNKNYISIQPERQ